MYNTYIFLCVLYGYGYDRFRSHLLADPNYVNLREKNEHYYLFGLQFALLNQDPAVLDMLQKCLTARFQQIVRRSVSLHLSLSLSLSLSLYLRDIRAYSLWPLSLIYILYI